MKTQLEGKKENFCEPPVRKSIIILKNEGFLRHFNNILRCNIFKDSDAFYEFEMTFKTNEGKEYNVSPLVCRGDEAIGKTMGFYKEELSNTNKVHIHIKAPYEAFFKIEKLVIY
ncbi:MAG: hypothetical protein RSE00_05895 [Clostridia bacterium]